jgi:DNA-binding FadR family transcriptional regulator
LTTLPPAEAHRFRKIPRERVADRVAQELLRLIAEGALAPGERLPGERQLAEMMSVSRVSVRAALQQLKAQGFVSSVQGGGTRVEAPGDELVSGLAKLVKAKLENLHDLAEIRQTIEVWAAARAAVRATPGQRAEIAAALAAMADPDRSESCKAQDDHRFHLAIAKASGSAVYMHLMHVLGGILEEMFAFHRHHLYPSREDDRTFDAQHRAIARAIDEEDGEGAAAAMARHLTTVLSRYMETGDDEDSKLS